MAREVKVHYWAVEFESGDADALVRKAKSAMKTKKDKFWDFNYQDRQYRLSGFECRQYAIDKKKHEAVIGTIFRKRSRGLPSEMIDNGVGVQPLKLTGPAIGEGASFAYFPQDSVLLVSYSHTGGRHSQFSAAMSSVGFSGILRLEPILKSDVAKALKNAACVRKFEVGVQFPKGSPPKPAKGGSVFEALAFAGDLGGVRMDIVVSLSRERTGTLKRDVVQKTMQQLLEMSNSSVVKLQADVRDGEDGQTTPLDLLHDRLEDVIAVEEDGARLDDDDCRKKLVSHYALHRSSILAARDA